MKRTMVIAMVLGLLIVLFVGCVPQEKPETEEPMVTTISEVIQMIEDNGWIVSSNTPPAEAQLVHIKGIVTYNYDYYAYVVDQEENAGIKLYADGGSFSGDDIEYHLIDATGVAYARDYGDAKEYRLYLKSDVEGATFTIHEATSTLPDVEVLPAGSELTLDLYGKYVTLENAVYLGTDSYDNYLFDNGGETITVYKYSDVPGDLATDSTYTISGVVGQNYGYILFIWDESLVTPSE
ncbi:MAG: hypothetical protein PWP37_805 [Thermotogota bacterium]|nr:hypothetical protein [Thermotogota bacterium]